MKEMRKKVIAGLVCFVLGVSALAACVRLPDGELPGGGAEEVEFWSAHITEKIMQDKDIYGDIKQTAGLFVKGARGEYESGQLLLTAKTDIKAYDIEIGKLTHVDNASLIFSDKNIEVYNQKYIYLPIITNKDKSMLVGNYPDALLPFKVAKTYKENHIKKGNNQGIWVTFQIPEDQAAGLYVGTVTVSYGEKMETLPVELEVWSYQISEAVTSKSVFLNQWSFSVGEMNSTQQMLNAYHDALVDFRLAPDILVTDTSHTDEDIAYYVDLAYTYLKNPRCSNISIPYKQVWDSAGGEINFDTEIFKKYIRAFVNKSIEKEFNLLEKLVVYMGIIDEPFLQNLRKRANLVLATYNRIIVEIADEVALNNAIPESELKNNIVSSIRKIPNLLTSPYDVELKDNAKDWVPLASEYNTQSERDQYNEQNERWWYTCVADKYPYATYQIDDRLVTSRVLSWMQADYDVVGNLFWATNIYRTYRDGAYKFIEDYYQTANRFPTANGDGFLFYPGKQYGMDTPVSSIRLHSIRDGLEEYETIQELKKIYGDLDDRYGGNIDAETVLRPLYDDLFEGTKVYTTSEKFFAARNSLAALAQIASSDAGAAIVSREELDGVFTIKILIRNGYTLKANGETVNTYDDKGDARLYTINQLLGNEKNTLTLSIERLGEQHSIQFDLGGKMYQYSAEDFANNVTITNGEAVVTEGETPYAGKALKLVLPAQETRSTQQLRITLHDLISNINHATSKFSLSIYNASSTSVRIRVSFRYKGASIGYEVASAFADPGANTITVPNIYAYSWSTYEALEYVTIYFGENGDGIRQTLYITEARVYMV